ncbi:MAG: Kelch repeat-containing protein [Candidatus Hodarchaeota archaeon]
MKNVKRIFVVFPLAAIGFYIIITSVNPVVRSNPENFPNPVGRFGHTMVFDPIKKCTILFGGTADNTLTRLLNDTWIYNHTDNSWKLINPITSPPARMNHGMVYDSTNQKVIIY